MVSEKYFYDFLDVKFESLQVLQLYVGVLKLKLCRTTKNIR